MSLGSTEAISEALVEAALESGKTQAQIEAAMQ